MFATLLFTLLSHPFPVPLVYRVCPSDVCRIWKSGASLRVDATLLGFENMTWIRGRRSYIFRGDGESLFPLSEAYTQLCPPDLCFSRPHLLSRLLLCWRMFHSVCLCPLADACTELMEVNHDEQVVDTERFDISREIEDVTLDSMQPAEQEVAKRLTTPIVNTFLDTRDIAFERQDPNRTLSCLSIV